MPISEHNMELVRQSYEAFERRDLDGLLDRFSPEIEVHDPPEIADAAVHRGREAIKRDWEQDAELAHLWTFKDGTPIRLRQFLDRAAALEAAGL